MNTASYPSVTPPEGPDTASTSPVSKLTSGRVLAGNTFWNFLGLCAPAVVAILCLPVLKHHLGTDRLGVLSLAWVVVGYFGLFDFGLSRALTKLVAERLGNGARNEVASLIWTSLALMGGLSVCGTLIAYLLSPWIVHSIIKVPSGLQLESLHVFYWLSISIPVVVLTAGLRGVLEALQEFKLATAIRIPLGLLSYAGPVAVLPFSQSLGPIVILLVLSRTAGLLAHFWACRHVLPELRGSWHFDRSSAGPLFRFGTWMSVSNIVGPLMVTFDRFVVGAMISVAAVAYYAVPVDILTKLLLLPTAVIGVMFPAFSTASVQRGRVSFLFESSTKAICIIMLPILLGVVAFAPEGLRLWLGNDFAVNSSWVVRCLAFAIFMNSVAQVPFAHLQGVGRPDITAILHLVELPVYFAALFLLVKADGIRGAALAWLLRVFADTALLFIYSHKIESENGFISSKMPYLLGGGVLLLSAGMLQMPVAMKLLVVIFASCLAALLLWHWALTPVEKSRLVAQFRGARAAE